MNYRIIKIIPIVLLALGTGIPYIIYEPIKSLYILLGVIAGVVPLSWYNYFEKKEKEQRGIKF